MPVCGLCGVVEINGPAAVETVAAMRDLLAHRGPDGQGLYAGSGCAIGFRRLAIIDLTEAGAQPMTSADGRFTLVHNGEIYNYVELRGELEARGHRFRSASDSEVVLAAFAEWGERCVERFNGMWAIAIWDEHERRLFCSRDRFGVKPFYYHWDGARFSFASELKAFRADSAVPLRPNLPAVRDFVARDWFDHTGETFFEGIVKLPAAHSLTLDRSGLRVSRYWTLGPAEGPVGDAVERVRELFLDAVRLRLRSDVKVGTCLSGGIDSSAVAVAVDHLLRTEAASARPVGERQATFTVFFERPDFDERPYARAVVDRILSDPTWVTFSDVELVEALPSIVEAHDEPFRSTSICAGWFVMRAARRGGVTVVLDGQGGDEVFAGYPAYTAARYGDLLAAGRLSSLAREARALAGVQGAVGAAKTVLRPFLPKTLEQKLRGARSGSGALLHSDLRGLPETNEPPVESQPDRLRRLMWRIATVRGLPELLHAEDRNSMAHSIEARVPFLDYRLMELSFALDGSLLIEGVKTKAVLRRALVDMLPPTVAARTDKLGFVTPESHWMRGALGELAEDVFASRTFADRGFVDHGAARHRLHLHRAGRVEAGFELWRVLNLELWARTFLDG